jgi:hypothetical protein
MITNWKIGKKSPCPQRTGSLGFIKLMIDLIGSSKTQGLLLLCQQQHGFIGCFVTSFCWFITRSTGVDFRKRSTNKGPFPACKGDTITKWWKLINLRTLMKKTWVIITGLFPKHQGETITNIARDYSEFRVSMEKHTWEKKHDLDGVGTSLQGTMSLG